MPYYKNKSVRAERSFISNGKRILEAETTTVLDGCDKAFSQKARDQLEAEQLNIVRHCGFDEVWLKQI